MTSHTDHPLRHWDRTCPACMADGRSEKHSEAPTPRTDAAENECNCTVNGAVIRGVVTADFARQLERELAAANRSLDWCGEQLKACAQYVKDGETIPEAMERNWQDSQNALGLFAKERLKLEALQSATAPLALLREWYDEYAGSTLRNGSPVNADLDSRTEEMLGIASTANREGEGG